MKKLTQKEINHITDYLLIETDLTEACVCMIFGGGAADELADHAAKLYKQGYFKKIIASGGVPTDDGVFEADRIKARLIGWGVPEEDILAERQATNTGENVTYSMPMLEEHFGGLDKIKRIICIGQMHGSRRFVMTLEKHWPEVDKMFTSPNHFNVPKNKWHTDDKFREDVLREFAKIAPYTKLGFLKEICIDTMNKKVLEHKLKNISNDNPVKPNNKKFKP